MTNVFKSIGLAFLYTLPCAVVYLTSISTFDGFHVLFNGIGEKIPSVKNYSICVSNPEKIMSLQAFNILYSILIPAIFFKRVIVNKTDIPLAPVILSLVLSAFGTSMMLVGFPIENTDGWGGLLAPYYCEFETVSFIILTFFAAGASAFYLMLFVFTYLYLRSDSNKQ